MNPNLTISYLAATEDCARRARQVARDGGNLPSGASRRRPTILGALGTALEDGVARLRRMRGAGATGVAPATPVAGRGAA